MGAFKEIGDFLLEITPSFRKARDIRDEIITHHRKNIRNVNSDRPVKTYVGNDTKWLDDLEREHIDLEIKYNKFGELASSSGRRVENHDRGEQFFIHDEDDQQELIEDTEGLISRIESKNTRSKIYEGVFYFIILALIVIMITVGTAWIC